MHDRTGIGDAALRKLERTALLTEADRDAVRQLRHRREHAPAMRHLAREGDRANECCILIDGFACRYKTASGGGRQIVSFHVPGDFLDLQHLLFERADHSIQTVTPATIAWVRCDALRAIARERPAVGEALWRDTLVEASIFREWVLNVGRRDAMTRVAHMLCEFAARCETAGIGTPRRLRLPMTQEHIADATGLTPVHVNRMLRMLRDQGVIGGTGKQIEIANWQRMHAVADFRPDYLHIAA